jgi:DNA-binding NarL/FixJ family response regulator
MRVVIGEDQALMRAGLSLVLEQAGFEIVAIAGDAEDVVRKTAAHRPDLLVTDIRMPPTNTDDGLRAAIEARARVPGLPVLVLSQYLQRDYAVELLESGDEKVGYLLKQRVADVERFVADLRRIVAGGTALDPEVVGAMVDRHRGDEDPVSQLTERQRAVLELMAQGRSNAAIAERLGVSEKAIVRHTSNIYDELGLGSNPDDHRRVLAVVRFLSA